MQIPLITTQHGKAAIETKSQFECACKELVEKDCQFLPHLPVIGLCHSLGGKITGLLSSIPDITPDSSSSATSPPSSSISPISAWARKANVFLCFNNFGFQHSSSSPPYLASSKQARHEFIPSPNETWSIIESCYGVWNNAIVKFESDTIDQSIKLKESLDVRARKDCVGAVDCDDDAQQRMHNTVHVLSGNHLQPNRLLPDRDFLCTLIDIVDGLINVIS